MDATVSVTKDNVREVLRAMQSIATKDVLVGIPEANAGRQGQGPSNATLAWIHEHGSPKANIPARPFLEPGIRDAQEKIALTLEAAASEALAGNAESAEKMLSAAGMIAQNAIRAKINTGPFTPLAASTLAARRRRGFKGTKPLIVTGQLRNSITYVVRSK